ncbi:lysozyme family protein [Paraliobacillus salinarum]|uniref:lysozyme family protein n=1 Tax=Paraliobacillus salinarum TaxID=1158996 RepID=UPI001FE82154|nr:lysozyme family protein [Paraliobacillus salinarum]
MMTKRMKKKWIKTINLTIGTAGMIALVLVLVTFVANERFSELSNEPSNAYPLTEKVLSYQPLVEKELAKENKKEYTAVVLALMMQESGGRGDDPMQASESACGKIGCIDDPKESIKKGVSYFIDTLEAADGDLELALQSYNFGLGFINYANKQGEGYSLPLAIEFSQMKYQELKDTGIYSCLREEAKAYNACYGDIYYVDAVSKYFPKALEFTEKKVEVAQVSLARK